MKKSILLFVSIFISVVIFAQWSSIINPSSYSTYGASIVIDNTGDIYSVGHVFVNSTNKEDIIIVKYNNSGSVLWTRTYDYAEDSDKAVKAIVDADNNLVIVATSSSSANGKNILGLKYTTTGDLVKTFVFDGTANLDDSAADIVMGENGNLYIGGTTRLVSQRAFVLIKVDSNLDQVWQKTHTLYYGADLRKLHFNQTNQNIAITGNYTDWENLYLTAIVVYDNEGIKIIDENYRTLENRSSVCFDVIANNDNSVYVCGYEANEDSNIWDALLMKYDANGDIIWSRKVNADGFPAYFKNMLIDDLGNIFVTGMNGENAIIAKFGSDGTQVWMQTHTSKSGFSTVDTYECIKQSSDGNIYVLARNTVANGGGAMIVKYNNVGEYQWTQFYNGSESQMDEPVNFCLDQNGSAFVIVNSRNSSYYFDMATLMLLNQDAQNVAQLSVNNSICVFPNPAINYFSIENPYTHDAKLEIYSAAGKLVFYSEISIGMSRILLDNFPVGIYFVKITTATEYASSKLIIKR